MRKLQVTRRTYHFAFALVLVILFSCGLSLPSHAQAQGPRLHLSSTLPVGTVGQSYSAALSVSGGVAPFTFQLVRGSLPNGLALDTTTGTIFGTPTAIGVFNFGVSASDANNKIGDKRLMIKIGTGSPVPPSVSVSPATTTVNSRKKQQFLATVSNSPNTAVRWSVSSGSISQSGLFTAPSASSPTTVTVSATLTATPSAQASAVVTVVPVAAPAPLAITTSSLPAGTEGTSYVATVTASGGTLPYLWTMSSGSLPAGIQLDQSGDFSGTATQYGNFPLVATVTDSAGQSVSQSFALVISRSSSGSYDGPAELPRIYIQSTLADTPAPGTTVSVPAGGNLQAALNQANCGDTIQLQAGATFAGSYTFPAKGCDDAHWIIVRTSASDSSLPSEGTRLTPCYAGLNSLPGRPALNCTSTQNVLAKLIFVGPGNGPIVFASGATHYRIIGIEATRAANTPIVYSLASIAKNGTADHIVFDRVWMHGTATDETNRAVFLGNSTYVSVVDSYLNDLHCTARTGTCTDAQAIQGGVGNQPMGPYKIVNNFLEASAQAILFGGGYAPQAPTDIEIRGNHTFKPMTWKSGNPGFVGVTFPVKNQIEFKNAQRVLVDGNLMENTWGGFSQSGFSILITPKNQNSQCPLCQVTDVTISNNEIRHTGSGMQIANGLSDSGGAPLHGERYSIHDDIFDDIDGQTYQGNGILAQVSMGVGTPLLQNILLDHITAFPANTVLLVGDDTTVNPHMSNFTFSNSIVAAGRYPVWSTGGSRNCAIQNVPILTLNACFSNWTVTHNALLSLQSNASAASWPAANFSQGTLAAQFVNFNNGNGGDYHLNSSSPFKNAGTDGRDLGADVDTVMTAAAAAQ